MQPEIRLAGPQDLRAINEIYNHYVRCSTCTYQLEPSTQEERQQWFEQHQAKKTPVTVFQKGDEVIAWASLSPFHPRPAYRFAVEDSIYVHPDHLRQGIGRLLLQDLIARSDAQGFRAIVALISADQEASVNLHARQGFVVAGKLRGVGFKFDRWLDVLYMQRGWGA